MAQTAFDTFWGNSFRTNTAEAGDTPGFADQREALLTMAGEKRQERRAQRMTWTGEGFRLTQCVKCRHQVPGERVCAAFPQGIPAEIWSNKVDHSLPYPGDNDIQFESALP